MSVEQTPSEIIPEKVRQEETPFGVTGFVGRGSEEWRSYGLHVMAAESRYRRSLESSRPFQLRQEQEEQSGQITPSGSDTINL